jgi:hypothetical protein
MVGYPLVKSVEESKTSAADAAYRKILNYIDIVWSKVLHLRKSGMDKAGTVGVTESRCQCIDEHAHK